MRAAIYGAGSLGTILGAYITAKGGRIDLINHKRKHVEALQQGGAHVVGTVEFVQPVTAYLPEQGIADIVGEDRVLGCTVAWGATMLGPGVCELTSLPDSLTFSLGSLSAHPNGHLQDVKDLLELMGPVTVEENFVGTRWSKLLINSAFSGMSTVLGCTFGEAAAPMKSRRLVLGLIKECIDVCAAGGIKIEPVQGKDAVKLLDYHNPLKKALSLFILPIAIKKHSLLKASMLQDLERGKKTEVDAINGAIAAYGRKIGFPTPLNEKVTELIHRMEAGELKPGFDNLKLF